MDTISVSLEKHLHEKLLPLTKLKELPELTKNELNQYVKRDYEKSTHELPYNLLLRVSRWSRSIEGQEVLKEHRLDPSDYTSISLLAGTVSSPSAKLPPYKAPPSPEELALQKARERKAISTLINAFLSVIGVGVAVWWAGGSVGMRPEHKALLSVFSSIGVALCEATLYLIWQWRLNKSLEKQKIRNARAKKRDDPGHEGPIDDTAEVVQKTAEDDGLRKRSATQKEGTRDT